MKTRLSLVACGLGGLGLLPIASQGLAQAPAPAPAATAAAPAPDAPAIEATLKQILTELAAVDTSLADQQLALEKRIDEEAAAGRLPAITAQNLRQAVRGASDTPGQGYRGVSVAIRVPEAQPALRTAVEAFEKDWGLAQVKRANLVQKAGEEVRRGVAVAVASARTAAEFDLLLATARQLKPLVASLTQRPTTGPLPNPFALDAYPEVLDALREVLTLQSAPAPDTAAIGAALARLRTQARDQNVRIEESAVRARYAAASAPFLARQAQALEAVEKAVLTALPAAEVRKARAGLEEVAAIRRQGSADRDGEDDYRMDLKIEAYLRLAELAESQAAGQLSSPRHVLERLGEMLAQAEPARAADWTRLLERWGKSAADKTAKLGADLRTRLAAVQGPDDLRALVTEYLKTLDRDRDGSDPVAEVMQALAMYARAWMDSDPRLNSGEFRAPPEHPFAADLTALGRRIERDIFATSARAPELKQPPLAGQPLDQALDGLIAQLAGRDEWSRIRQLAEARGLQAGGAGEEARRRYYALAGVVRDYLAAQNMELAEQWADALQLYKAVLRSTSEQAPVRQAAARVKALSAAHPEAAQPPPPAAAARNPIPPAP